MVSGGLYVNLHVAILQIDITYGDPVKNQNYIEWKMGQTEALQDIDVVVMPELWNTGYDLTRLDEIADPLGENSQQFLSQLAKRYSVNIVGGSVAKIEKGKATNTMYVFNKNGELQLEYSKAHLFQLMDEHKYLSAGSDKSHFDIEGYPSSGFICYDIRFPEWMRTHTINGSEILFVVAQWPTPRIDHWRSLLISRAIENQCYVVACNRVGSDPKNSFGGHSIIVNPWGEVITEAGDQEMILEAELDMSIVEGIRTQIPIFQDRRTDLYE
nr:carbon-nitrogen family hydrolase [Pontibacillus sp. HN14]